MRFLPEPPLHFPYTTLRLYYVYIPTAYSHFFLHIFIIALEQLKLEIDVEDAHQVRDHVRSYLEGLTWVLAYYHLGCSSWTWYFPYLYAPLGTDLVNLASLDLRFERGLPFTPLLQLLSVLPPQSGSFLPKSYEAIMTSPESPLLSAYPKDFEVDANGKKQSWECIVRIPFINSTQLVDAASKINHKEELTETERLRNILGTEHRFNPPGAKGKVGSSGSVLSQENSDVGRKWGNALADYIPDKKNTNTNTKYRRY